MTFPAALTSDTFFHMLCKSSKNPSDQNESLAYSEAGAFHTHCGLLLQRGYRARHLHNYLEVGVKIHGGVQQGDAEKGGLELCRQ